MFDPKWALMYVCGPAADVVGLYESELDAAKHLLSLERPESYRIYRLV